MFEKMLAQSNANLQALKMEKEFLIGNIFYLPFLLSQTNSEPETINNAIKEITTYLSSFLESINYEWEIMNAINRYLYHICTIPSTFHGFDMSNEFTLFKGIFELLNQTYPKRASEYMWYIRAYKNYADTNRISNNYKIIAKREHLSKERYERILTTIPKV